MISNTEYPKQIESLEDAKAIIKNLAANKRHTLEQIWIESKQFDPHYWADCKRIRLLFDNDDQAVSFLNSIGGLFVTDQGRVEKGGTGYQLTIWGMFACPSLTCLIKPTIRIIEYVRDFTKKKEVQVSLSDTQICDVAKIDHLALKDLKYLFSRCDALSSLIRFYSGNWTISLNDSVTKSRNFESAAACLTGILQDEYRPWMLVHDADRKKREWDSVVLDRKELLKLVIRYLSFEDAVYRKIKRAATIYAILLLVILPGFISGIAGLLLDGYAITILGYVLAGLLLGFIGWFTGVLKEKCKSMQNMFLRRMYRRKTRRLIKRFISTKDSSLRLIEETRRSMEGYEGLWPWRLEMHSSDSVKFYVSDLTNPAHRSLLEEDLEDGLCWEISLKDE